MATASAMPACGAATTAVAAKPAAASSGALSMMDDPWFTSTGAWPKWGELMSHHTMKMDVKESDTAIEVHCDVPGFTKEEVKVEVDADNVLHVSAAHKTERKEEGEKGGWKFHRMERSSSSQYRSMKLPVTANTASIGATCTDGVLAITVPKIAGTSQVDTRRRIAVA